MIIKNNKTIRTNLSTFDLLGNDEVALSKAFSYLLGAEQTCYFEFLRFLGLRYKNNNRHFYETNIQTECKRHYGRTDIELSYGNSYHIIIECKVRSNRLNKQRSQYLDCFDANANNKVLCFITRERDTNKQIAKDVTIISTSWFEVIDIFASKKFTNKPLVTSFLNFATRNYKMKELKEILIQDVNTSEIERFEKYNVYRRDETFGTPIYFAPYYTRGTKPPEGISKLARVLGILTLKPTDIHNFVADLEVFAKESPQINKWINGVKYGGDNVDTVYTYYFLDKPYTFTMPLRKDGGIKKGRGKNWIAAQIPPNRCVTFEEFIKHIPQLM